MSIMGMKLGSEKELSAPGVANVTEHLTPQDLIDNPPHYISGGIECIDALRANLGQIGFEDYCRGQVIKYTWRARFKGTYYADMAKAVFYGKMAGGNDPRV